MNTNSNLYTVIYTAIIVTVVAAVLAFVSQSLKDKQEANEKAERNNFVFGLVPCFARTSYLVGNQCFSFFVC